MLEHSYDPPLEFELSGPVPEAARDVQALVLRLPAPPGEDEADDAFFYRKGDEVVGYFNRCSHISVPLDLGDGRFLDLTGTVICRVHGALYELESGAVCRPPARTGLTRILCEEREGRLFVHGWKRVLEYRKGGCQA